MGTSRTQPDTVSARPGTSPLVTSHLSGQVTLVIVSPRAMITMPGTNTGETDSILALGNWIGTMRPRRDQTTSVRSAWVGLPTSDTTTTGKFPTSGDPTTIPT